MAGRAAGPWGLGGPCMVPAPSRGGGGGDPRESGREGRPGQAPAAGGGLGAVAAAPGPARLPQGSERPGGSGGSAGELWERRSGQRLGPGPRGGTAGKPRVGGRCGQRVVWVLSGYVFQCRK